MANRRIVVSAVKGAHTYANGAASFVLTDDEGEITLDCDPTAVMKLLMISLEVAPGVLEHDGFRVGHLDGEPTVSFRFGEGRWLSILLGPEDFHVLRTLLDLPAATSPAGPSGSRH